MSSVVIVGSQWGDEGKGKMTDYLSQDADVVVREITVIHGPVRLPLPHVNVPLLQTGKPNPSRSEQQHGHHRERPPPESRSARQSGMHSRSRHHKRHARQGHRRSLRHIVARQREACHVREQHGPVERPDIDAPSSNREVGQSSAGGRRRQQIRRLVPRQRRQKPTHPRQQEKSGQRQRQGVKRIHPRTNGGVTRVDLQYHRRHHHCALQPERRRSQSESFSGKPLPVRVHPGLQAFHCLCVFSPPKESRTDKQGKQRLQKIERLHQCVWNTRGTGSVYPLPLQLLRPRQPHIE